MAVKFDLNKSGVGALLKGPEVQRMLAAKAREIAARAGGGFESDMSVGSTRANARVRSTSIAAAHRAARDHTLERAVGGG